MNGFNFTPTAINKQSNTLILHLTKTINMGVLTDLYIKKETLQTLIDTITKKGEKGVAITVSISDTVNDYGQNVTSYVSQSKEQRESKANRYYVGNGKVFWTDGNVSVAPKQAQPQQQQSNGNDDNLPF